MHRICAILSVGLVAVLAPGRAASEPAAVTAFVGDGHNVDRLTRATAAELK
jgi:hypothetical protein